MLPAVFELQAVLRAFSTIDGLDPSSIAPTLDRASITLVERGFISATRDGVKVPSAEAVSLLSVRDVMAVIRTIVEEVPRALSLDPPNGRVSSAGRAAFPAVGTETATA